MYFTPRDIGTARPDLWAGDDPGASWPPSLAGNANLTGFVQDGYLGRCTRAATEELTELNDGLRERARAALAGYLCAMDRVCAAVGARARAAAGGPVRPAAAGRARPGRAAG